MLSMSSALLFAVGGCGKQEETAPPSKPAILQPGTNAPAPAVVATQPNVISKRQPRRAPRPVLGLPELEKKYYEVTTKQEKMALVNEVADHGTKESLALTRRLFQSEQDEQVKDEMLTAIWAIDGLEAEKLEIYRLAVKDTQPQSLRESAIDDISDLEDPAAEKLLKELLKDPNSEIREAAKDGLEFMKATRR